MSDISVSLYSSEKLTTPKQDLVERRRTTNSRAIFTRIDSSFD